MGAGGGEGKEEDESLNCLVEWAVREEVRAGLSAAFHA